MSGAGLGASDGRAAEAQDRPVTAAPSAPKPAAGVRARFARPRQSVWMPVAAKAAGIFVGMLALAGIGAWSTLSGAGVPLALASGVTSAGAVPPAAVPSSPPATSVAPPQPSVPSAPSSGGIAPDGRVVLNLATAEELTKLPRVGPKRAENILALRQKLGRFKQPTDLLRVKGIGRKTLQLMLPKLVVDLPKDAPQK